MTRVVDAGEKLIRNLLDSLLDSSASLYILRRPDDVAGTLTSSLFKQYNVEKSELDI